MGTAKSTKMLKRASKLIPGGVNSPVRAFNAVGGKPVFIDRAKGAMVYDIDGNAYIDYVGSWGPMILGHADSKVISAIKKAAERGTSYGAPTGLEVELAELTLEAFPSMDMVRFVSSGTEATMSAIRLARAHTGRDKIMKFDGCYHGHEDSLLVNAGSGVATLGIPGSPGVPKNVAENTYTAKYNNLASVREILEKDPEGVACIIVEAVPGNMGVVPPKTGFLEGLRVLTSEFGVVFIMDEVMSGFRLCYGGAQDAYKIIPDMTCLGKVIGGGMPVGAFGGKKGIMEKLAPSGPVYQAGTLSGNPLAMTAGITTLTELKKKGVYEKLIAKTEKLCKGIKEVARRREITCQVSRAGSMFTLFFTDTVVKNFDDAKACDLKRFSKYFGRMLKAGVMLPPSQFEANFMSLAHTDEDIENTLKAVDKAFKDL